MIYLFKVYVLVIGLVLLVTLVVVLVVMITRVMFTTIGKAAEYAFILKRRASTRLKYRWSSRKELEGWRRHDYGSSPIR